MIRKDTLLALRFPYSQFTLPVFLFACSQTAEYGEWGVPAVFAVFFFLVYPSANANAWYHHQVREATRLPLPSAGPNKLPRLLSLLMDAVALALCSFHSGVLVAQVGLIILSNRVFVFEPGGLHRFPLIGQLWLGFFRGGFTYWTFLTVLGTELPGASIQWPSFAQLLLPTFWAISILSASNVSGFGKGTLSHVLGYSGTLLLSLLFLFGSLVLAWFYFNQAAHTGSFWILLLFVFPLVVYLFYWIMKVLEDEQAADYDHATRFRMLATACLNMCFILFLWMG